jgi:hypothetical protein
MLSQSVCPTALEMNGYSTCRRRIPQMRMASTGENPLYLIRSSRVSRLSNILKTIVAMSSELTKSLR